MQGDNGADTISNIRSGVAAENAVSIMQERGFSNSRKSRHRLTPGTVKFAAFHILSMEGDKGLSILEVADKIQVVSIAFLPVQLYLAMLLTRNIILREEIWS